MNFLIWLVHFVMDVSDGYIKQGRRHGEGGGEGCRGAIAPPMIFYFFCLSAQRSVMSMMTIPHYDNFKEIFFEVGKKMCRSPPPPPPPPLISFFRTYEAGDGSCEAFCPPSGYKSKHPGAAPGYKIKI